MPILQAENIKVLKNCLIVFCFFMVYVGATAQGFILRWSGGYAGQPTDNLTISGPYFNTRNPTTDKWVPFANISDSDNSNTTVHNSYGQGFNISMRFGYMFNPYIGLDLGVTYAKSTNITALQTLIFYQPDSMGTIGNSGGYTRNNIATNSQSVSLNPCVIAAYSKPAWKISPYLRAGLTFPVWTEITHTEGIDLVGVEATPDILLAPYFLGTRTDVSYSTTANFSMGVTGAIGFVWKAFPFVHFNVELNGQYLTVKGKNASVTQWSADGNDLLGTRTTYRNQFNYVSSLNSNSNNAAYNAGYDTGKPKDDVAPKFPYSNIGFNIGIQVFLNKKIFKDQDQYEETRKHKKKKSGDEPAPEAAPAPNTNTTPK